MISSHTLQLAAVPFLLILGGAALVLGLALEREWLMTLAVVPIALCSVPWVSADRVDPRALARALPPRGHMADDTQ